MKFQTILWRYSRRKGCVSIFVLQSGWLLVLQEELLQKPLVCTEKFTGIFSGTDLTGIPFIGTAFAGISSGSARNLFRPDVSEDPVGGVGSSFTVRSLGSELDVRCDFTFDLVAKATSVTDFSELELASC